MNISPVSFLNFNSGIKTKNYKNSNEDTVTSPLKNEKLIKASSDTLKAYNPQISFKGKVCDYYVELSEETISEIERCIKSVTGDDTRDSITEKMFDEYVFSSDLLDVLNIANNEGQTVAHHLAFFNPESYVDATKDLTPLDRHILLKTTDKEGETVAHRLAYASGELYIKATDDLAREQKFDLLKAKNDEGHTVAHRLALESPDSFVKAIEPFTNEQKYHLMKMADKYGVTVAHDLAYSSDNYFKATEGFYSSDIMDLLETADNDGRTVLDTLGQKR